MKVGDIYIDGIKVGAIDLSIEERNLAFEPQLASLEYGADADTPGPNAPIRVPRDHGGGYLGPDGPPAASPPSDKQPRHGGPTFRPGIGPGSRQRREKQQARDRYGDPTTETPHSPSDSHPSESRGHVGGGQAWLAKQREPFKKELEDNPRTKEWAAAIISSEHPQAGPAVVESLMNRTALVNEARARKGLPPVTLWHMMHSGFYGPINTGKIRRDFAAMAKNPNYHKQLLGYVDQASAGSNVIRMHTDQGGPGDKNYITGGRGVQIGHERYNDWGYPGSREFRQRMQQKYEDADRGNPPSTAADSESHAVATLLPSGPTFRRGVGPGAQVPRPEAPAPPSGPTPTADPSTLRERPGREGVLRGVSPALKEVMAGGIAAFEQAHPGYRVQAFSGYRQGGGYHGQHIAGDFEIVGPQGTLESRGADPTGLYHELARYALGYQMKHRPDLTGKFTWGGAFGTQRPSGGPPDLMHFDLGGWRGHYTQNRIERLGPLYPPPSVASTAKPQAKVTIGTPTTTSPKPSPPDATPDPEK